MAIVMLSNKRDYFDRSGITNYGNLQKVEKKKAQIKSTLGRNRLPYKAKTNIKRCKNLRWCETWYHICLFRKLGVTHTTEALDLSSSLKKTC